MKNRTLYGALAVTLAATMTVSACGGGSKSDSGSGPEKGDSSSATKQVNINKQDRSNMDQGGTMSFNVAQMPVNWNMFHSDGNLAEITEFTRGTDPTLYDYSPDGTVTFNKDFLESMPKAEEKDGKEVATWTVNPKAKWNDGTPIDWTAFEATWKSHRAPMEKGGYNNVTTAGYENIEKVEKGSKDNEVVITFKQKFYPLTEMFKSLVHPKVAADPKVFNEGFTNDQVHNEWRANAFIISKVDAPQKTFIMTPNPKWWGEKPMLDKIVVRQMEDSATIPAFKNGETDRTGVANKSRFKQIQGAKDLDLRRSQRLLDVIFTFNSKSEGLNDVNVRKALWQAFDRQEWKKIRYDGLNWTEPDLGSNMYFSFQKGYEDNFPLKADPAEAQKTLQAAGYTKGADGFFAKNGKKLTVKYTTFGDDPMTTALAQLGVKQGKAAGIDVQLDIRPSAAFSDAMKNKDFGIIQMAYSPDSNTPVTSVCQLMCVSNPNNMSFAGTKELDARMMKVGQISDGAAQAKEINAIEKEWFKQTYGTMPLASGPQIVAYRKGMANIGPSMFQFLLSPHWENVGWQKGMKKG